MITITDKNIIAKKGNRRKWKRNKQTDFVLFQQGRTQVQVLSSSKAKGPSLERVPGSSSSSPRRVEIEIEPAATFKRRRRNHFRSPQLTLSSLIPSPQYLVYTR
jgi:hypothetical protein